MQNRPDIAAIETVLPKAQGLTFLKEGGFKAVYHAKMKGNPEAIKVVYIPTDPRDEQVREENRRRVRREVAALHECKSLFLVKPGSVEAFETKFGEHEYIIYSEEFLPGETLDSRIARGERPSENDLLQLMSCLIEAVEELWNLPDKLVHRDIKPRNVMATGDAKRPFILLDLGIAFAAAGTPLTVNPQLVPGTREYLAPEMLLDGFRETLDYRSDLYAVGLTAYEYACGVHPFRATGEYTTYRKIAEETPPALAAMRGDLAAPLCELIDSLLKKKPAIRPNLERVSKALGGLRA